MGVAIIIGLFGGLLAIVIGTYISANSRKAKKPGQLQYGVAIFLIAFVCLVISTVPVILFVQDIIVGEGLKEIPALIGLFVMFGTAAAYCFGEYFKVGGKFDKDGIEFYTPWTGHKSEKWTDIQVVEFNSMANWYELSFKSGDIIRISNLMYGYKEVLKMANYDD